jgi:hypothetical protein
MVQIIQKVQIELNGLKRLERFEPRLSAPGLGPRLRDDRVILNSLINVFFSRAGCNEMTSKSFTRRQPSNHTGKSFPFPYG